MKTTLPASSIDRVIAQLRPALVAVGAQYPGLSAVRQPVHTVYGGAHLFKAETSKKLGAIAIRSLDTFAPDAETFAEIFGIARESAPVVFAKVAEKLRREAIEDLRLDFEDGYGIRSDEEEDEHAASAGLETGKGMEAGSLPPFFGIRVKPFGEETTLRAVRTLDIYLTTLCGMTAGKMPQNFVITLPKIVSPAQITAFVGILDELEDKLGIATGKIRIEIMVETVQSIMAPDGGSALPRLIAATRGRCAGAHFGAYDYTADCGITSQNQDLQHSACDFARHMMQVSLSNTGVHLSDGATTIMPIAPHRGEDLTREQMATNKAAVHAAWKLHYDNCRHALKNGFYQGWDLHPAQIPARYAAVYTFFIEGLDAASERLKNFVEKAARATLVGNNFDDAATGQGLLNFFTRGINCGAVSEREALERTGISIEQLRSGSFAEIIGKRVK